jgi:hypothetical protein
VSERGEDARGRCCLRPRQMQVNEEATYTCEVAWPRARSRKTPMPGKAFHCNRSRNGRCVAATACVQRCFSILIIDTFAWINRLAET